MSTTCTAQTAIFVVILVVLLYLLSFFSPASSVVPIKPAAEVKVAIANMVTTQPNFDEWIRHHLDVLGVDRVYLRIENAPDIVRLAQQRPDRIIFEVSDDTGPKPNNYFSLIDRQRDFISRMIERARVDGIDYLFHIDADELIHVPDGPNKLREYLLSAPSNTACIHMKNFEAVFNNNTSCFDAAKFLDCQREMCKSYANGKSAAVIRNNPRFHGPHYFTEPTYEMPDDKIRVLHFDSCTFESWKQKFSRLAASADPAKTKEIPFPFYRDSIAAMKTSGQEEFYRREKWTQ